MLTLESEDSLGLLGGVLGALASCGLFPVEMHIETREGRAYDSLWLAGAGGARPSRTAFAEAQRLLAESCGTAS
jgi:hypothetical protein